MRVTTTPPIDSTDRCRNVGTGGKVVHLADVEPLLDTGGVGRVGHVETEGASAPASVAPLHR